MNIDKWTRIGLEDDVYDVIESYTSVLELIAEQNTFCTFTLCSGSLLTIRSRCILTIMACSEETFLESWRRVQYLEGLKKQITGWEET